MIEFGEWLPDLGEDVGAQEAKNVVALADGYTQLKSLSSFTTALADACLGAFWMKHNDSIYNFAGDRDNLYNLASGITWNEVSKVSNIYNSVNWEFAKFGGRAIAVNKADNPQYFDCGTSTKFADMAGTPPQAARIAVVGDFIVLGDLNGEENVIQWSGYNNSELWTPSRATQSDKQTLFGKGGKVQRIVPGAVGVIFQEHSIRTMAYAGPPTIFNIQEVDKERGTPAPNSVCWSGSNIYFYSHDGFYVFNGTSMPIGDNRVNKWFKDNADVTALETMRGVVDRRNNLVMWAFSSSGTSQNNKLIIYNIAANRWSHAEVNTQMLYEFVSPGSTLDELTTIIGLADIDSESISVDSDAYKGGAISVAAFDSTNKTSTFSGAAMAATITTREVNEGNMFINTSSVLPAITGDNPTITAQIGFRDRKDSNTEFTTAQALNTIGEANIRKQSRYQRYQVNITNGFTHAKGVTPEMRVAGVR